LPGCGRSHPAVWRCLAGARNQLDFFFFFFFFFFFCNSGAEKEALMPNLVFRVGLGVVTVVLMFCWMTPVPMDNKLRVMLVGGRCCNTTCENPQDVNCPAACGPNLTHKEIQAQAGGALKFIVSRPNVTPCGNVAPGCDAISDDMKGPNGCVALDEWP
jgi:hypothetical protein